MKITFPFLYIVCTLIYLRFADGGYLWGGFGKITVLLFIVALSVFVLSETPNTEKEKLFLRFALYTSLIRAIYTGYCSFIDKDGWVIYNTDVFEFGLRLFFGVFLLYIAVKNDKL